MLYAKKEVNDDDQKQEDTCKVGFWGWKETDWHLGRHPWRDGWENDDEEEERGNHDYSPQRLSLRGAQQTRTVHGKRSLQQGWYDNEKGKGHVCHSSKKGETGRECTQDDVDLDMEAAEATWPNLKMFFGRFKNHPALGPGAVEDSGATPSVEPGPSAAAQTEHGEDATKPLDLQAGHQ